MGWFSERLCILLPKLLILSILSFLAFVFVTVFVLFVCFYFCHFFLVFVFYAPSCWSFVDAPLMFFCLLKQTT